jgi:propanediol dehydratase small subunit
LTTADYPLAEKRPDLVRTRRLKKLEDITLSAIESGEAVLEDIRITPTALLLQAEIAEAAGRPMMARNFERAADIVDVPQDFILKTYELLRPGRAKTKNELLNIAEILRDTYKAERMAAFIEEAADVYERRGLFTFRF